MKKENQIEEKWRRDSNFFSAVNYKKRGFNEIAKFKMPKQESKITISKQLLLNIIRDFNLVDIIDFSIKRGSNGIKALYLRQGEKEGLIAEFLT